MADDCELLTVNETQLLPPEEKVKEGPQMVLRNDKIAIHYGGKKNSLTSKVGEGAFSGEELLRDLVKEYLREVDNLAGSQVIATENGDIHSSTIISSKRTEIIDRAIKAIMHKKEFEAQNSIDVESPSMFIVFRYFLEKCTQAFADAGFSKDVSNPFFHSFDAVTKDWKKELKKQIAELKV